MTVDYEELK